MKKILSQLFLSFFLVHSVYLGHAQEELKGLKQIIDFTIDKLGNATVEVSMKLNATQWDYYKKNVGSNVSILKRSMETALPKYYLTDFSYSEDQMDRSYKVKFKALGICSINKDKMWEAKLDTKNPDITRISDREFVLNEDVMVNGMLVQQTQKLHLPSGASGGKIEKDSFGKAVFTYSTGGGIAKNAITGVGILLILGGIWLFYRNSQKTNKLILAHMKTDEKATRVV